MSMNNNIIQFYANVLFISFLLPFWIIYIVECQLQMMCQYLNGHHASLWFVFIWN